MRVLRYDLIPETALGAGIWPLSPPSAKPRPENIFVRCANAVVPGMIFGELAITQHFEPFICEIGPPDVDADYRDTSLALDLQIVAAAHVALIMDTPATIITVYATDLLALHTLRTFCELLDNDSPILFTMDRGGNLSVGLRHLFVKAQCLEILADHVLEILNRDQLFTREGQAKADRTLWNLPWLPLKPHLRRMAILRKPRVSDDCGM